MRRARSVRWILGLTLWALGSACETRQGLERDRDAAIQTSALSYRLEFSDFGSQVTIPYTLTNRTGSPVFIVNCNGSFPHTLERWTDGRWERVWGNNIPDCLSLPIVIAPGETFERELEVFGGFPTCNCSPAFAVEDPRGEYRLVLIDLLSSFDAEGLPFGPEIDVEFRTSNRFRLF